MGIGRPITVDVMQPTYPPETEQYREKISAFLDEHLPSNWRGIGAVAPEHRAQFQMEWRETLRDNKLLAPNWPAEYGGGGLTHLEQVVLNEEFAKRGVPTSGSNDGFSIGMVGNTILHWGSDEQKAHFIPRILSGEDVWCQGYSEPNAGSDLANLGCKAELDGDEWVVNGQKIWTSSGQTANMIFVSGPDRRRCAEAQGHLVPPDVDRNSLESSSDRSPISLVMTTSTRSFFTDAHLPEGQCSRWSEQRLGRRQHPAGLRARRRGNDDRTRIRGRV